jgi:lipopolysaccharide heptosyltransferase II
MTQLRPAVFIDKDGTLVKDVPYNVDPDQICLLPGVERLRELTLAGYELVLVSNQSGVARGYFDEAALQHSMLSLEQKLREVGVRFAGVYWCPHHPTGRMERYRLECDCRKPNPGLFRRAAEELSLDLERSWMVGDILNDVEAGARAGCRTVHIDSGHETEWLLGLNRLPHRTVSDLAGAVDAILASDRELSEPTRGCWADAKSMLCIRLDTLGDVLMTTPAIRALKECRPDREVTLLTSTVGAAVARLVPEIDDVIVYDAPWMKGEPDPTQDRAIIDALRGRHFDAAVLFSVYSQNVWAAALLCHLAEIRLRLGYSRENPYNLLTDWAAELEPERFVRHEVQRQLELVRRVGARADERGLSLHVSSDSVQRARGALSAAGIDPSRPWVAIHPGSRAASRRYPGERFAAAASELARVDGWQVCFTGSMDELSLVEAIRDEMEAPSVSLAGFLDLESFAALMGLAPLLITNNTGPAHIAAALGTPQVVLYALTNLQHMPWQTPARVLRHDVPCRNCYRSVCPEGHHDCLRAITPDDVVGAAREMFEPARLTTSYTRQTLNTTA